MTTNPKDTPATSGSADQAVMEAIRRLQAFNGFVKMGVTHHVETDYVDDVETLIQAAEQTVKLREHLRIEELECQKQCAEKEELRQRVKILEGALSPFANVAEQISKRASNKAWLEQPLFFMGDDTDPQKWTLTGKAFNDARKAINKPRSGVKV